MELQKVEAFDVVDRDSLSVLTTDERQRINICKKIRAMCKANDVEVDLSSHRMNENSDHLFKFIEKCGYTVREFVLGYVRNIQPYDIVRVEAQEFDSDITCIVQLDYSTPIYIKVLCNRGTKLILSFHENQNMRLKVYRKMDLPRFSVLLYDDKNDDEGIYNCTVCRVFFQFKLEIVGREHAKGVVKCNTLLVTEALLERVNEILQDITNDERTSFSSDRQISFTSYGSMLLNNISILIDYLRTKRRGTPLFDSAFAALEILKTEIAQLPDKDDYKLAIAKRYNAMPEIRTLLEDLIDE